MGNIILSNDFVIVPDASITARSQATGYVKANVMDLWHLKRRFRADDANKSDTDYLIKFDFGAARVLEAIFINDVNFDKVRIYGHSSDLGNDWSTASYQSGDITISQDTMVNRYKLYHEFSSFNYQYLAIGVPTSASAVGAYTTKWEVGTVVFMETVTELSENMSYGYEKYADMAVQEISLDNGLIEAMSLNDNLRWHGRLVFDNRSRDNESDLHAINALDRHKPLVFFENMGSTQYAYLCVRRDAVRVSRIAYNVVRGSDVNLVELV